MSNVSLPTMRLMYNNHFNVESCDIDYVHACLSSVYAQAKAFVADPSAFAALVPAAATTTEEEKPAAAKEPEPESEESDDDMGFGLFD